MANSRRLCSKGLGAAVVTSHATDLSNPSSSASLVQLLLGRLLTDSTCPLQPWRSRPLLGLTWLSGAKTASQVLPVGDMETWELGSGFPLRPQGGLTPKAAWGGLPKGKSHKSNCGTPPGKHYHLLNFLSHITFCVAFVTCHTYRIHLEIVSFAGFWNTHFCLIPKHFVSFVGSSPQPSSLPLGNTDISYSLD